MGKNMPVFKIYCSRYLTTGAKLEQKQCSQPIVLQIYENFQKKINCFLEYFHLLPTIWYVTSHLYIQQIKKFIYNYTQ